MSDPEHNRPQISAALRESADKGATSGEIAEIVVSTLLAIMKSLSPIIGKGGVIALYRRALSLVQPSHPWLSGETSRTELDAAALASLLAQQDGAEAAAAGGALLQKLSDLLAGLIGAGLTERLFRPVWANFLEAQRNQGPSS